MFLLEKNEIADNFDWTSISHLETIDLNWCGIDKDTKTIIKDKLKNTQVWTNLYSPKPYEPIMDKYHQGFKWKPGMDIPKETSYLVLDGVGDFPREDELPKGIKGILMGFRATIEELPEYISELSELELLRLKLSEKANPDKLANQLLGIGNLKQLELNCPWEDLPESFAQLKIESLNLDFPYTKKKWEISCDIIGGMKNLIHLDLSSCWNINHFQSFKELKKLEWILIGNDTDLNNLFATLKYLPNIKIIDCDQNFFDKVSLSSDLGQIKSLESLGFHRNPYFHKLPSTFTQLENLRYMDIRNNSFPKSTLDKILREMPWVNVMS